MYQTSVELFIDDEIKKKNVSIFFVLFYFILGDALYHVKLTKQKWNLLYQGSESLMAINIVSRFLFFSDKQFLYLLKLIFAKHVYTQQQFQENLESV